MYSGRKINKRVVCVFLEKEFIFFFLEIYQIIQKPLAELQLSANFNLGLVILKDGNLNRGE
jgi:hypothetical protein